MTCEPGKLWADARLTPRPFIMTHVQEDAPTYMKMLMVRNSLVHEESPPPGLASAHRASFHHYMGGPFHGETGQQLDASRRLVTRTHRREVFSFLMPRCCHRCFCKKKWQILLRCYRLFCQILFAVFLQQAFFVTEAFSARCFKQPKTAHFRKLDWGLLGRSGGGRVGCGRDGITAHTHVPCGLASAAPRTL